MSTTQFKAQDIYSPRVHQLDALALDNEFGAFVETQLQTSQLELCKNFLPELEALVKGYIWWHSVKKSGATIGQSVLQLCYYHSSGSSNSKQLTSYQVYGLAAVNIIFPWLKRRISNTTRIGPVKDLLEQIETALSLLNFINSLLFLYHGSYRSISERILRLKCGSLTPGAEENRQVPLEFMNRELLWHAFAEFLTFVLPMINFYKLKNTFVYVLRTHIWKKDANDLNNVNQRTLDDLQKCAICNLWPLNAHQIGCKHVFCYYCISSSFLADKTNGFNCPVCFYQITSFDSINKVKMIVF